MLVCIAGYDTNVWESPPALCLFFFNTIQNKYIQDVVSFQDVVSKIYGGLLWYATCTCWLEMVRSTDMATEWPAVTF